MSSMREVLMMPVAHKLVHMCGRVKPGETVVIVTDYGMDPSIAKVIAQAAMAAGANPNIITMPLNKHDSREPAKAVAEAMKHADVLYTPVSVSITHTEAMKTANSLGARGVIMTDFDTDMMIRGGMEANFEEIAPECDAIAAILDKGSVMEVTTELGTDLRMDIKGREGISKTCIAGDNDFTPACDIEATVSPVEGSTEGVFVCDCSIPYLGIGAPDALVTGKVEKGMVTSLEGGEAARKVWASWQSMDDPMVFNFAELGIGLNPFCSATGRMLEDEGIRGTCHCGIGTSITLGGQVKASCHYDFVMYKPTIRIDGTVIVKDGEVVCL
ncbi:MAG: hypothetical protein WD270_04075 [Acetobacterales bacterium]